MKDEKLVRGVFGAAAAGAAFLLFRQVWRGVLASRARTAEVPSEGLSPDEAQNLESRLSEALSDPPRVKTVETSLWQQLDDMNRSLDEMLDSSAELLRECGETTALAEAVLDPPNRKVVVLPPWRFQRLAGIPAPHVVDARRLDKLPAADIRRALHRAYAGNLQPAKRLHAQLRLRAERAVSPLRESAVGALEDMYVLHPNADFGDDVIDV